MYVITDIERELQYKNPRPDIRKLIQYLINENILVQKKKIYNSKYYKINRKLLINFIDSLDITTLFYQYFKNHPRRLII